MADTVRGDFPDTPCSDCGEIGVAFRHTGNLVPEGKIGNFCVFCWNERLDASYRKEPPKPLGVKPPGVPKEFADKAIKVTTQSGSVYELSAPNEKRERNVFCSTKSFRINKCEVLSLALGKDLWLRSSDEKNLLWATTRVVLIE